MFPIRSQARRAGTTLAETVWLRNAGTTPPSPEGPGRWYHDALGRPSRSQRDSSPRPWPRVSIARRIFPTTQSRVFVKERGIKFEVKLELGPMHSSG